MNYKTQLNAWAMEMALKYYERVGTYYDRMGQYPTLETLENDTKRLVEFAYNPQKDFEDHAKDLFDLIRKQEDPLAALNQIVDTLEYMREDIEAHSKIRATLPNGQDNQPQPETVQ